MKQVDKTAYQFGKYTDLNRWVSYFHQIDEVLKTRPQTLLEIGVGDGALRDYIKSNTEVSYTSLDIADDLKADVVGSVLKMPFVDNSFDTICAFEVLEHLPFEQFEVALAELRRVSKGNVILSLPHFGPQIKFLLKLPFLPLLRFAFKIPYARVHVFDGQHYWEIGKRGFPSSRIRESLRKYFNITNEFVPFENQYHHFFMLKKI
jgi:ubiquinone/menaquinone biosynthesis C-methylase UbiE